MKIKKLLASYWIIPLFLVVFFLRLPSLFEPFTYGDEGIYLTLGLAIRKGLTLYSQIHDNKPPLLYLIAALTGNFAYYRALFFAWSLVTIYVFWRLAEKIFPKNQKGVAISTFAFGILTSVHTFEGNIANAENFMLLPTILGVILVLKGLDEHAPLPTPDGVASGGQGLKTDFHLPAGRQGRLLLAGVMFSLAVLFKVPAAFDFLAILVFLGFVLFKTGKFNISHITSHISLVFGFFLPILLTLFYYATKGALNQYLTAAFLQNIPYLTSWGTGSHSQFSLFRSGLFLRGTLLLVICYWLLVKSKNFSQKFLLIAFWFLFSLFAALLSARPYPHYLIQVLPSLSLLFGFLTLKVRKEKLFALFAFSLFAFSFCFYRFWHYSNLPYYQNFYQYLFGQKSKERYFVDFDPKANDIYQAAEFVSNHTLPDEKVFNSSQRESNLFIWGNEPYLYALSRRLPPGRYTVAYHIIDFDGWEETVEVIEKDKTGLIMTAPVAGHSFPALNQLLGQKYIKIGEIGEYKFFRRLTNLKE